MGGFFLSRPHTPVAFLDNCPLPPPRVFLHITVYCHLKESKTDVFCKNLLLKELVASAVLHSTLSRQSPLRY